MGCKLPLCRTELVLGWIQNSVDQWLTSAVNIGIRCYFVSFLADTYFFCGFLVDRHGMMLSC